MLNESPRLVHHAQLQGRCVGRFLHACGNPMKDIEQQRLEERWIRSHLFEIEDLEALERERVLDVVEQARVAVPVDPVVEATRERSWQEIGHGEQPALARVQYIEVLNRLVHFTILAVAESIPIAPLQQSAPAPEAETKIMCAAVK